MIFRKMQNPARFGLHIRICLLGQNRKAGWLIRYLSGFTGRNQPQQIDQEGACKISMCHRFCSRSMVAGEVRSKRMDGRITAMTRQAEASAASTR